MPNPEAPLNERLKGGCLCKRVRFELQGQPDDVDYCDWSMCRRDTGAPAAVLAWVQREA